MSRRSSQTPREFSWTTERNSLHWWNTYQSICSVVAGWALRRGRCVLNPMKDGEMWKRVGHKCVDMATSEFTETDCTDVTFHTSLFTIINFTCAFKFIILVKRVKHAASSKFSTVSFTIVVFPNLFLALLLSCYRVAGAAYGRFSVTKNRVYCKFFKYLPLTQSGTIILGYCIIYEFLLFYSLNKSRAATRFNWIKSE